MKRVQHDVCERKSSEETHEHRVTLLFSLVAIPWRFRRTDREFGVPLSRLSDESIRSVVALASDATVFTFLDSKICHKRCEINDSSFRGDLRFGTEQNRSKFLFRSILRFRFTRNHEGPWRNARERTDYSAL